MMRNGDSLGALAGSVTREAGDPGRSKERDAAIARVRGAYAGKMLPGDQLELFRNRGWIFSQREIARGSKVHPLPRAAQIQDVAIRSRGERFDLADYVSRNRVAGLLILEHGRIAFEHYELGNDPSTHWISMSVAKSISATLVGAAIRDGFIRSVDDPLIRYLPALARTAYDGVTVRHLLQMSTGLSWDETQTDAGSERREMLELQIEQQPGIIMEYLASRPRLAEPGALWIYGTGEAHVVGALLHAATGCWVSDYLSAKIWSVFGMESSAQWWLESPGGLEVAGSGINATLRDYGRFGQFFMNEGTADRLGILPDGWLQDATAPRQIGGQRVDYGYMWWPVPAPDGSFADGAFSARGIFGQYIYVNPARQIVVVTLSARSKPRFAEAILDNDFFNSVVEVLR